MAALRFLAYFWASPTTFVGLVGVAICAVSGGKIAILDGVVEAHGGFLTRLLGRYMPIAGGALAMTLGHVVLGQSATALTFTRAHERVHVRQCERWGPLFLPAYLLASIVAALRGGDAYRDNAFEREAYAIGRAPYRPRNAGVRLARKASTPVR